VPVVIDGNNLLHSLSPGSRTRGEVRRRVLEAVRDEHLRITVVFDGPPPEGAPDVEHLGSVIVRYSGAVKADDVILGLLPKDRRASESVVVTDDRQLRRRVQDRGARVRSLAEWRRRKPRKSRPKTHEPKLSSHEVADWEAYFASSENDSVE
jgi:hypothetical protein